MRSQIKMKYRVVLVLAFILTILLTAFITYRVTMLNLHIETDGNGDTAIVTVYGQSDLYDINTDRPKPNNTRSN